LSNFQPMMLYFCAFLFIEVTKCIQILMYKVSDSLFFSFHYFLLYLLSVSPLSSTSVWASLLWLNTPNESLDWGRKCWNSNAWSKERIWLMIRSKNLLIAFSYSLLQLLNTIYILVSCPCVVTVISFKNIKIYIFMWKIRK
jgi:hypothetical protein